MEQELGDTTQELFPDVLEYDKDMSPVNTSLQENFVKRFSAKYPHNTQSSIFEMLHEQYFSQLQTSVKTIRKSSVHQRSPDLFVTENAIHKPTSSMDEGQENLFKIEKNNPPIIQSEEVKQFIGSSKEIDVKSNLKSKVLQQVHEIQVLEKAHDGPIWCLKCNSTKEVIATGGADGKLIFWKIIPIEHSVDKQHYHIIQLVQIRSFLNIENGDVVCINWSNENLNYLICSSMDKHVRIFHYLHEELLFDFQSEEIIIGCDFIELNEVFFATVSLDQSISIFQLAKKQMILTIDTDYLFTCLTVAISPITAEETTEESTEKAVLLCGTVNGKCIVYEFMEKQTVSKPNSKFQLSFVKQFDVKSKRGKNSGKKVTGIVVSPSGANILITTNDSRIRQYGFDSFVENCKYIGPKIDSSQIFASYDHFGKFVISGSESSQIFIWKSSNEIFSNGKGSLKPRNAQYEVINSHDCVTTCCIYIWIPNTKQSTKFTPYILSADFKGNIKCFLC